VLSLSCANQKVVRLDISVQIKPGVHVLHPLDELVRQHEHSFQGELTIALLKQFFKTRSQFVHHHAIAFLVLPKPIDFGNANSVTKDLVHFVFVNQLRLVGGHRLLFSNAMLLLLGGGIL